MDKSELIAFASLIVSILTFCIAVLALNSWKKQFNKNLLRDFVLDVYDSIHEIDGANWKAIDYLNKYTEINIELIRDSALFLNPIPIHQPELLENSHKYLPKLSHAMNRLNRVHTDKHLKILCEQYLICIYEINEFLLEKELIGYNNDFSSKNQRSLTLDRLDKICDQETVLQMQIEEKLLKLLKL